MKPVTEGFAVGALVGIAAMSFAMFAAGAGHGSYLPAKILFPFTMLSTVWLDTITGPFILLAVLQFPIYGIVLAIRGPWRPKTIAGIIASVHMLGAMLAWAWVDAVNFPNFP